MSGSDESSSDYGEDGDGSPLVSTAGGAQDQPHADTSSSEDEEDLYGSSKAVASSPRRSSPRMQSKGRENLPGLPNIRKTLATIPEKWVYP